MTITWSWAIEAKLGGTWVDLTRDVIKNKTIKAKRGMSGGDVTDRVAGPGALTFSLDNGESNSGGKLGYYSVGHANCRTGFAEGMGVRLKLVYGAITRYVWNGRMTKPVPTPGQFGDRQTNVTAVDFMDQFNIHKLNRIPVQIGQRTDQILPLIIANMPYAPLNTAFDVGPDTFPYALQDEQDEKTYAITVLQKCVQSDLGDIYVRGNATDGETLVYESRNTRILNRISLLTLDNAMSEINIDRGSEKVNNNIHVPVTPTKVDAAATTVLATNPNEILLNPDQTQVISMRLVDPSGAGRRISGVDYVDPLEADTDYKFSSVSGNGGNDLNANLSVTYVNKGGNTVDLQLHNTGAQAGYVQKDMQVRGKGIYLYDTQEAAANDSASQLLHGDHILTYQIPYQDSFNIAQDFANELRRRGSIPFLDVRDVMYYADLNDALMTAAVTLDMGDRFTMVENASGLNSDAYINGIEYDVNPNGTLAVRYIPELAALSQVCILDDPNSALLDVNAYLAF